MIVKINPQNIVYAKSFQGLCRHPFYGHGHGCPNFNKKQGCPPQAPLVNEALDFSRDVYLIFTEFNVGEFAEKTRQSHPGWKSERQWYNPRYWQLRARKFQRKEEAVAVKNNNLDIILRKPEANGVNVTKLMADYGVVMSWAWPPKHFLENNKFLDNHVYLVSLGGYKLRKK